MRRKKRWKYNTPSFRGFVPKFPVCPSLTTISLQKRRCRNGLFGDLPPARRRSPGGTRQRKFRGCSWTSRVLRGFCDFIIKRLNEASASHLGLPTACETRRGIVARAAIVSLKRSVLLTLGGQKRRFFAGTAALSPCYRDVWSPNNATMLPKSLGHNGEVGLLGIWFAFFWWVDMCNCGWRIAENEVGNAEYSPCRQIPNSRCCLAGRCKYAFGARVRNAAWITREKRENVLLPPKLRWIIEANFIISLDWGFISYFRGGKQKTLRGKNFATAYSVQHYSKILKSLRPLQVFPTSSVTVTAPSCKYIRNDKLNPIICHAWAVRSLDTGAYTCVTALENNSIPIAFTAAGTSGIKDSFENLHVSAAPSDADVRNVIIFLFLCIFSQGCLLQGTLERAAFPWLYCTLSKALGVLGADFLFQYDKPELDFLTSKNTRAGRSAGHRFFQAGRRSDPATSAEIFQYSDFGKVWILKPSLGQRQLEAKIIILFSKKRPVIIFFLSYLLAQRFGFGFFCLIKWTHKCKMHPLPGGWQSWVFPMVFLPFFCLSKANPSVSSRILWDKAVLEKKIQDGLHKEKYNPKKPHFACSELKPSLF